MPSSRFRPLAADSLAADSPAARSLAALCVALLAPACRGPAMGWPGGPVESAELLADYKAEHYAALGDRATEEVGIGELIAEAAHQRIVYLGDHHLDFALHDQHLLLLRNLHADDVPLALALECYGTEDQPAVDSFLAGELDMPALRSLVRNRWPQSWLGGTAVDSRYYRDLLTFARDAKLPVTALEPTPRLPLEQRDPTIAANLRGALATRPDRVLVVVVGHAHILGPGHLRDRVDVPSLVVAARPSDELAHELAFSLPRSPFVRTENGHLVPTRWTP